MRFFSVFAAATLAIVAEVEGLEESACVIHPSERPAHLVVDSNLEVLDYENEAWGDSDAHLYSTFDGVGYVKANGITGTLIYAYDRHLSLHLTPDQILATVTRNVALYVHANAETLRSQFVAHKGKEEITVRSNTENWPYLLSLFGSEVKRRVFGPIPTLLTPNFTTTTPIDIIVSDAMIMATFKEYFSYHGTFICGIPSVQLGGTHDDWLALNSSVNGIREQLPGLGEWFSRFQFILILLIDTSYLRIDSAGEESARHRWRQMVNYEYHHGGCTQTRYVTGWVKDLDAFDSRGKGLYGADVREPQHFGSWIVSVPVKMTITRAFNATVFAGFLGMKVENRVATPVTGVYVVEAPPKDERSMRLYERDDD